MLRQSIFSSLPYNDSYSQISIISDAFYYYCKGSPPVV